MVREGTNKKGPLKAVIFDVDGTLVDSNNLHVEAWIEAFRDYGKEVSFDEVHPHIGKGGDQLIPEFLNHDEIGDFGKALEQHRVKLFQEKYLDRVRPFPKVRELFERLKAEGLKITLASSSTEPEVEKHKENLQIKDLVDGSTSADDAERSKPSPDIFDAALKSLADVKPDGAIIVGDSPWDVIAANKLGIQTIGLLSGGFSEDELRAAGAVEIYKDAADLLAKYDSSRLAHAAPASVKRVSS